MGVVNQFQNWRTIRRKFVLFLSLLFDYALKDLALVSSSNFVFFSFTACTVTAVIDKIIKGRKSIIDSVRVVVELAFLDTQHQTCDSRERDKNKKVI